jgi:hypothetical protein
LLRAADRSGASPEIITHFGFVLPKWFRKPQPKVEIKQVTTFVALLGGTPD